MDVGAEVEVLRDGVWTRGVLIDRYESPIDVAGAVATVKFDDGSVRDVSVAADPSKPSPGVRLREAALDDALDVDDLTSLVELSESTLLSALECRFRRDKIYTNTGTILLAVNPFQKLQGTYDRNVLQRYIDSFEAQAAGEPDSPGGRRRSSQPRRRSSAPTTAGGAPLPPHVYQVAGEAYRQMLSGMNGMLSDQSILVSGESGSGKTESTKFLMQYLAAQAGGAQPFNPGQSQNGSQHGIAAKVLQTNILLESFGNARTLRNDNSSRFGKFIKLHFTSSGKLTGASIQTYLLEKVRLVSQSKGERNYHIFYEMSMGASAAQRQRWRLDPPPNNPLPMSSGDEAGDLPEAMRQFLHYRYLNQSQCYKRHDGVEDREMFQRVHDALEVVGFTPFEQDGIFDLLAALMHIGNLTFEHDDRESTVRASTSTATDLAPSCIWSRDAAAHLLAVDAMQLERALSVRKIRAGTDFVSVKLSAEQANNARDALAKALYGRLFDWMVGKINEFLKMDDSQKSKGHFIGILDIFGFEVFPHNSFEQLCINFANETLQLQFNDYVFKMEQQEYEAQGVDWKYVEFLDNQDCVNLISQRPYGILPLIDEECLIPKGNDMTFASKVYKAWDENARFTASRIQKASGNFTIIHYAGPVEYSTRGFLEKNKDTLHQEAVDLLVYSPREGSFTRTLNEGGGFRPRDKASPRQRAAANKQRGASVGWQFKEQLTDLLETLHQTNPHYVRCLKPNDACEARMFSRDRVMNQLRCNGVMEAVRVARAGYPIRVPHEEFVGRYFCLKRVRNTLDSTKALSDRSLNERGSSSSELVVAEAKELLRDLLVYLPKEPNQEAQSAFENSDQVQFSTRCISVGVQMGFTKMFLKKTTYDALEDMRAKRLRRHMIKVYHAVLCVTARCRFLRYRRAVQSIQVAFRYRQATKQRRLRKLQQNARIIQANLQMVRRRNQYRRFLCAVKFLQCRFRYRTIQMRKRRAQSERAAQAERERQTQLARQREAEREEMERRKREQQEQQPLQFKDSYTASSDSSSEASLTSNDVEGSGYNSASSEDTFPYNDQQPYRKHTLKTVDEGSNQLMPRKFSANSSHRPSQINNIRPLEHPPRALSNHRVSRTFSDALYNHQQHAQSMMPHRASVAQPPRKSSFRSTRSSRTVALPRLDVVQQTQWVNDEDRFSCHICNKRFNMFKRKHHCRACGEVICNSCSLYHRIQNRSMRVCVSCVAFHSLESPTASSTKSTSRGVVGGFSANRKTSTGSNFELARSEGSAGSWMNAWPEPPYPDDEDERLTCLRELNIRDLATSGKFNMYCEVAAKTMKCPIAYVSIIEDEEQILVANIGMAHTTLPRELSFCAHTICQPNVLVVLDTKNDDRFRENPMVKGDKGAVKIRYYAGATIFSRDGHALGTVAVLDTKPRREADQEHIGMLQHLSFLASEKMMQSTIVEDSDSELL